MTTGADWVDSARRLIDAVRPPTTTAPAAPQDATAHGEDCRWCPMCQAAAVLRGERPEVSAALADVLATTAAVLRELAREPDRGPTPPSPPDGPGGRDDGDGPVTVQRIDIA